MLDNQKPVEVIQADRDAAAEPIRSLYSLAYADGIADQILAGKGDGNNLVQAFARHRLNHTRSDEPPMTTIDNEGLARLNALGGYQHVFNAIAVATSTRGRVGINVSVSAFIAALGNVPALSSQGSTPEGDGEVVERVAKAIEDRSVEGSFKLDASYCRKLAIAALSAMSQGSVP